jgi:hypothetical protein
LLRERSTIAATDYDALQKNQNAINQFISDMQKAGVKKGDLAKELRTAFDWAFTADGKAKSFGAAANAPSGAPSHLTDLSRMSGQANLNTQLNRDLAIVNQQANIIVKGIAGGKTLSDVIDALKGDTKNNKAVAKLNVSTYSGYGYSKSYASEKDIKSKGIKAGQVIEDQYGNKYTVGAFVKGSGYSLTPKYNFGGKVSMPRYNTGGPVKYAGGGMVTQNRRNYGNALYNINVELNGSNLDAQDVARAIRKEMELRELASGPGRKI